MSVISFKEIHNGRDGADEVGSDGKRVTRYTRVFRAVTDSNTDDADTVGAHDDCPKLLDAHPQNSWATCRRVRPRNESFSKVVWIVTCAYSTAAFSSDELEPIGNPLLERANIDWSTAFYTRPCIYNLAGPNEGKAVMNAAARPFDPPVEADDSRWGANVTKNVAGVPSWLGAYGRKGGAVNSDAFKLDGYPVGVRMAKISGITISKWQERNGIAYQVLIMRIDLDEDTWVKSILNDGFYTKDGDPCVDETGKNPVTEPAMLKADGTQLPYPVAPASINYISVYPYYELPFSVLPLT